MVVSDLARIIAAAIVAGLVWWLVVTGSGIIFEWAAS
jgi:hypothetical protein